MNNLEVIEYLEGNGPWAIQHREEDNYNVLYIKNELGDIVELSFYLEDAAFSLIKGKN